MRPLTRPASGLASPQAAGFTLFEFVLVMVLLGLLAAVGSNMLSDGFFIARQLDSESAGHSEARYALERIARELRGVKRLAQGDYCFEIMEPARAAFRRRPLTDGTSQLDADFLDQTDCNKGTERVEIALSGHDLVLAYGSSAANLSRSVSGLPVCATGAGFCLRYLAADGSTERTMAGRNSLVFIEVALRLQDASHADLPALSQRIALRND